MLYKKYHRNHVKQFRRGVKFKFVSIIGVSIETIDTDPIIELTFFGAEPYVAIGILKKNAKIPLIYSSGQLAYYSIVS